MNKGLKNIEESAFAIKVLAENIRMMDIRGIEEIADILVKEADSIKHQTYTLKSAPEMKYERPLAS